MVDHLFCNVLQCFECRVLYQNCGNRRASTPTSELKGIVEEETEESELARSKTRETVNEANEKEEIVTCKGQNLSLNINIIHF